MHKKNKPFIFEGLKAEQYKKMRNKWIRLAVISSGIPFLIGILIGIFKDPYSLLDLFGNGEIILLLFTLNLPIAFDLFEVKQKDDEYLAWAFWGCTILVVFQSVLYCLIRMDASKSSEIKSIISSLIMMIASWISCVYSIKAIFQHSISDERGEDNVN